MSGASEAQPAFSKITEVCELLDEPPHVLRKWETKFKQVVPVQRAGGRRYYRREVVELLRGIRYLMRDGGYTVDGIRRIIDQHGVPTVAEIGARQDLSALAEAMIGSRVRPRANGGLSAEARERLRKAAAELRELALSLKA